MTTIDNETAAATRRLRRVRAELDRLIWITRARLGPVDERGGGRNSDEGFHISGGAVLAGLIAAGVGAFIARQLGVLDE